MPGKRVHFDDESWHAPDQLAKDRMEDRRQRQRVTSNGGSDTRPRSEVCARAFRRTYVRVCIPFGLGGNGSPQARAAAKLHSDVFGRGSGFDRAAGEAWRPRVRPLAQRQSPDMKPKKRRRFVSFFDPLASSNHCSASLDQNSRSSTSTAAAANLSHS
jgi:hypothetical protein